MAEAPLFPGPPVQVHAVDIGGHEEQVRVYLLGWPASSTSSGYGSAPGPDPARSAGQQACGPLPCTTTMLCSAASGARPRRDPGVADLDPGGHRARTPQQRPTAQRDDDPHGCLLAQASIGRYGPRSITRPG
jgi:hypothetical protein